VDRKTGRRLVSDFLEIDILGLGFYRFEISDR
jgi:hypothetical protein